MNIFDTLDNVTRIFLDTAPVIYFVERNPQYFIITEAIFQKIDSGQMRAVTSSITLAECLVIPIHQNNESLQQDFQDLITNGVHTQFQTINQAVGILGAQLRAQYNLTLADALQIASAIEAGCDTFLTNDVKLKRVSELPVLVLADFI